MKNLKNNKMLLGIGITFLLLATISMSYAWFSATVKSENVKDQVVTTGTLELTFTDGPEIKIEKARPGQTVEKTVSVKNTGTLDANYNLVWQELTNEIINDELTISIACKSLDKDENPSEACEGLAETPISNVKLLKNISIESGYTHNYVITITFKELSKDQNYNQGKNFEGVLGINEYKETKPIYCNFEGDLVQGTEFIKGKYTYRYMQEKSEADTTNLTVNWKNKTEDGWGVALTNPLLTDDIETNDVCTYINDKPVIFMGGMFALSQSKKIDLSNLDTSNVISMTGMFGYSQASLLDLSNLDTSKVTDMTGMFYNSKATTVDLNGIDTSNVTTMEQMFDNSNATEIIGLKQLNTSNVTSMESMFLSCGAHSLDVSGFDTSKVTNMNWMFNESMATEIKGLENFDTSEVTNMGMMFARSKVLILDLSNFDTSNVTNMEEMFYDSSNLKTIYVSEKFVTDKVNKNVRMFYNTTNLVGGNGTVYDENKNNATYARVDTVSTPGYFTLKNN